MQQKLNSFKTFKDNGILVICWIIIWLFAMLLPLTWGVNTEVVEEAEEVEVEEISKEREPWDLNLSWDSQEMPVLIATESHQRFIELCEKLIYQLMLFGTRKIIID